MKKTEVPVELTYGEMSVIYGAVTEEAFATAKVAYKKAIDKGFAKERLDNLLNVMDKINIKRNRPDLVGQRRKQLLDLFNSNNN